MDYYGSDKYNWIMSNQKMRPRYAGLARKLISHYLGDLHNPHTFDPETEAIIRALINDVVELKVTEKVDYDWHFLDNYFRKFLNVYGYPHLTFDQHAIDKGYHGVHRSELPQFHA